MRLILYIVKLMTNSTKMIIPLYGSIPVDGMARYICTALCSYFRSLFFYMGWPDTSAQHGVFSF